MNRRVAGLAVVVSALAVWVVYPSGQSHVDDREIRALATEFERAWNLHDMNILGSITTEDVDFVNVAGLHWKGRTEVVAQHGERHAVRFRNSVWTTERVSVQRVASDVALVHVEWQTQGDLDFDLKPWPPRKGIFSWLVVTSEGRWKIRSAHNTGRN